MQVWLGLDMNLELAEIPAQARRAEALGCDVITLADVAHDALLGAQAAISATSRVDVATSGLVCFARSPMITALGAWNLAALSQGRFRLGLSSLVPQMLVGKYSVPWHPPAVRMREYIGALHALWRSWQYDEPLQFEGSYYRLNRQNTWSRPRPLRDPTIRLHLGALGPLMTKLAASHTDGLLTHPCATTLRYISEVTLPRLREGEHAAERVAGSTTLIAAPLLATGHDDAEIRTRREQCRRVLATNLSTPQYWGPLALSGRKAVGERLRALVREGKWDLLAAELDDEMLDELLPAVPWSRLADELLRRFAGVADGVCLQLPVDARDDAELARVIGALRAA